MLEELSNAINKIENVYFERNERDFAYELYHQLKHSPLPKNIEITCETSKNRFSFDDKILDSKLIRKYFFRDEINQDRKIYRYPDLLIHEYHTRDHQLLAIEIKRTYTITTLLRDLSKLVVYCYGKLKYQKAVMIIVNPRIDQIMEIPQVKELLIAFPLVEIWIVRHKSIIKYNSSNI
ncbi:hypothetical protein [Flavobacterium sp.]|uniref:hypothetical protein n=1 Tax=Flavobacterium sp. TaxID=239 RepID=UPI004047A150